MTEICTATWFEAKCTQPAGHYGPRHPHVEVLNGEWNVGWYDDCTGAVPHNPAMVAELEILRRDLYGRDSFNAGALAEACMWRDRSAMLEIELTHTRQALAEVCRAGDPGQGLYCGACGQDEHDDAHKPWCPVARVFPDSRPGSDPLPRTSR